MHEYIEVLPAFNGDSIFVKIKNGNTFFNIFIDGGIRKTYEDEDNDTGYGILKERILTLIKNNESIDLLIITHIDDDHIDGILAFIEDEEINKNIVQKYWFNSSKIISEYFNTEHLTEREIKVYLPDLSDNKISVRQGITLEDFLMNEKNKWHSIPILFKSTKEVIQTKLLNTLDFDNFKLTLLSPTENELRRLNKDWIRQSNQVAGYKKNDDRKQDISTIDLNAKFSDYTPPNNSSIAFIMEYNEKNYLFLADASHKVILQSLQSLGYSKQNKLPVEYLKLSHHGSKRNTSKALLEVIDCENFIISTDGLTHFHPNKFTLLLIIDHYNNLGKSVNFFFNYDNSTLRNIFSKKEIIDNNLRFTFHFPSQNQALKLELK